VTGYLGIVTAQGVLGVNAFKDVSAQMSGRALAPSLVWPDPVPTAAHRGEHAATVTAVHPGNPRSKALPVLAS
jgi:hypothetical protein